jgi:hypothetical protein
LLQLEKPFTIEDRMAADLEKKTQSGLINFKISMLAKYGDKARERTRHFDALNYHPNDRRRCVRFDADDFRRAKEFGLLFIAGCRIVDGEYKSAV